MNPVTELTQQNSFCSFFARRSKKILLAGVLARNGLEVIVNGVGGLLRQQLGDSEVDAKTRTICSGILCEIVLKVSLT